MKRSYYYVRSITSTNTALKEKLRQSADPVFDILSAGEQTGGRGRQGRRFLSPKGGIYFSAAYLLPEKTKRPAFLPLYVGLSVQKVLQKRAEQPIFVKWPNDIYANEKKIGGVLTELLEGKSGLYAVVGVGLNVKIETSLFPTALDGRITDLSAVGFHVRDREALIKEIIAETDRFVYEDRVLEQDAFTAAQAFRNVDFLYGKRVTRDSPAGKTTGIAAGVDDAGRLILQTENGELHVDSGAVEWDEGVLPVL